MDQSALVLEGGALRCLFTAGVLSVFEEKNIHFPCVVGVSAGAMSAVNYVAGDAKRTATVNINFVNDKRYLSLKNLIRNHSIFNFDFLFGEIADTLIPFDYKTFNESKKRLVVVSTDCHTGKPVYHEHHKSEDIIMATRASSSMPLLSKIVQIDGVHALDGGISMPVPFQWAIDEGYKNVVLLLTRQKGYRKKTLSKAKQNAYKRTYKAYPQLVETILKIPQHYNELMDEIDELEENGKITVIRPQEPVLVSRVERDIKKLQDLFEKGRAVGERVAPMFKAE